MYSDVDITQDFQEFFGQSKAAVLAENPSEAPRLGLIGDSFFTAIEQSATHAGEFDYGVRMADSVFGGDWSGTRILDFGDVGIFTGLKLFYKGFSNVCVVDEPSLCLDFLQFLCDKHHVPVLFQTTEELFSHPVEPFHYVICQRAISEFGHPLAVLAKMRRLMANAGFLYLCQMTNCHPLFSTARYLETLHGQGYMPCWDSPDGNWRGFQRIR